MKTICILGNKIVMAQDGVAIESMEANAAQYPGATVETIDDAEFDARMAAQQGARVPSVVTMRQARLAMLQTGMLASVNTAVAAADEATKITWEFSGEVQRSNPLVSTLAAALNLTDAQLDDLFKLAATL